MVELPSPDQALPAPNAIGRFWLRYWLVFFALLPFIAVRTVIVTTAQLAVTIRTFNRSFSFLDGRLQLLFVHGIRTSIVSIVFGERFGIARFEGTIIDPGPPFAAQRVVARFARSGEPIRAIAVTHAHEERIGSAGAVATAFEAPLYGSDIALRAIESPPRVPFMRRMMIGQPRPSPRIVRGSLNELRGLRPIASEGHCSGHVSYFAVDEGILFVGDSFMDEVFTAPNGEVSSATWRETLSVYTQLDIRTMIGTHGIVTTLDPRVRSRFGVVQRADPKLLIARKLAFLDWATEVVRIAEDRGLPYSVIEASLFPWAHTWSWKNFALDELARLLTRGEFSRTQFVRSLSRHPDRVPARFGWLSRRG